MGTRNLDQETVIVGAGQAGLATAWHLGRLGRDSLVLDAGDRIGDAWRARWDSLRLFTPARNSALPGQPHADPATFLGKDEFADYLELYATGNRINVRNGQAVESVTRDGDAWLVGVPGGTIRAAHVVVATGSNARPHVPSLAATVDGTVCQLHSSDYRNPGQVRDGEVLVVGAGTSGVEIALELAATHNVSIAGRPTPHVPEPVLKYAGNLWWAFISNVLTMGTPIGRKAAAGFHGRGSPLLRVSMRDLDRAGVRRLPRLESTAGLPATVIWCTGYRAALDWFPDLPLDAHGYPSNDRGVVSSLPGVYTVGMPFQWGLTSELIGGVGRDAGYVAGEIAGRVSATWLRWSQPCAGVVRRPRPLPGSGEPAR